MANFDCFISFISLYKGDTGVIPILQMRKQALNSRAYSIGLGAIELRASAFLGGSFSSASNCPLLCGDFQIDDFTGD